MRRSVERRIHERHPVGLQVRVTEVAHPELSASGQAIDLSKSGLSVYLPLQFTCGSAVRLNIKDSVLVGFVAYAEPDRSYFRTGIEVVQGVIGGSDLSQLLKEILEEVMPEVEWVETLP